MFFLPIIFDRDVTSDTCHGSTISSADCLRKLNHAQKVGQLYRLSDAGLSIFVSSVLSSLIYGKVTQKLTRVMELLLYFRLVRLSGVLHVLKERYNVIVWFCVFAIGLFETILCSKRVNGFKNEFRSVAWAWKVRTNVLGGGNMINDLLTYVALIFSLHNALCRG